MLRLVSLPFSLVLLVVSIGLVAAGLGLVAEGTDRSDAERDEAVLDRILGGNDDGAEAAREGRTVNAGVSMIGFGILGAIAAVALLVAALSERREEAATQQQQQQVVVVSDGDARVETGQGR